MAYVNPNFKTKAALKEAVKAGERVEVFQPGPFPLNPRPQISVTGPHYPAAHTWYATVEVRDGVVVKVVG